MTPAEDRAPTAPSALLRPPRGVRLRAYLALAGVLRVLQEGTGEGRRPPNQGDLRSTLGATWGLRVQVWCVEAWSLSGDWFARRRTAGWSWSWSRPALSQHPHLGKPGRGPGANPRPCSDPSIRNGSPTWRWFREKRLLSPYPSLPGDIGGPSWRTPPWVSSMAFGSGSWGLHESEAPGLTRTSYPSPFPARSTLPLKQEEYEVSVSFQAGGRQRGRARVSQVGVGVGAREARCQASTPEPHLHPAPPAGLSAQAGAEPVC